MVTVFSAHYTFFFGGGGVVRPVRPTPGYGPDHHAKNDQNTTENYHPFIRLKFRDSLLNLIYYDQIISIITLIQYVIAIFMDECLQI